MRSTDRLTRREVVLRAIQIPVGGALLAGMAACGRSGEGGSGGETQAALCADPNAMSEADNGTRAALNYKEQSPNPSQVCAGCSFFHASASGGACGTCDMFSGGPVNPHGHCDSWNAKG